MTNENTENALDLAAVKKWAKGQEKQFKDLKKKLEKTDDVAAVLKALDVANPGLRTFRNAARKLQREVPTAARFQKKLLRATEDEVKRFGKILALV